MPPASPATTLVWRILSSSRVLPWSTWPMTVTIGGRGRKSSSRSSSSSSKYFAWSSASCSSPGSTSRTTRADLCGEQLDHVVGERLRGGHHLALEEQETDHVSRRAVELRTELARRRAALHDHLAVGNGSVRRRVGRELRRFELFEIPAAPTRAPLWRPSPALRTAAARQAVLRAFR